MGNDRRRVTLAFALLFDPLEPATLLEPVIIQENAWWSLRTARLELEVPMPDKLAVVIQSRDDAAVGLRRCADLASRWGASLHVIDVTEPPPSWLRKYRRQAGREDDLASRRGVLERFVSNVKMPDVRVSVVVRRGQRVVELVHEVLESDADLVAVVAPDRRDSIATTEAFLNRVVRKSPVPVLILRPHQALERGTVVAVDFPTEPTPDGLIDTILTEAVTLTRPSDPLVAVHVLELPEGLSPSEPEVATATGAATKQHRRELEARVSSAGRIGATAAEVRLGRPVEQIASVVTERHPEFLIVGTISRSGVAGLIIGTTAEALLREVNCSVLAVKPPGFRTPLS